MTYKIRSTDESAGRKLYALAKIAHPHLPEWCDLPEAVQAKWAKVDALMKDIANG